MILVAVILADSDRPMKESGQQPLKPASRATRTDPPRARRLQLVTREPHFGGLSSRRWTLDGGRVTGGCARLASTDQSARPLLAKSWYALRMAEAANDTPHGVISHVQFRALHTARRQALKQVQVSLDLGLSLSLVELDEDGVDFGARERLDWTTLESLEKHENQCFEIRNGELHPIRGYSATSHRTFQLMPTSSAPALLISGFVMHRIRDVSPTLGAKAMVDCVLPVRGRILDTATGLGYAAIEAARHATEVLTIELEPLATEMARRNPWSRALFERPNITRRFGDSSTLVAELEAESFAAVVHDPPAISLAGDLYSEHFYAQIHRVLTRGGRFFHYVGDPKSKSGSTLTRGITRRLLNAGFSKVIPKPAAFGFLALK